MMDMEYCKKFGIPTKRFEDQVTETVAAVTSINKEYNRTRMLPFIAADANREDVVGMVKDA